MVLGGFTASPIIEGIWGALAALSLSSSSALFGLQVDQCLALGGGILMQLGGCVIALRRSHIYNANPRDRWHQVVLSWHAHVAASWRPRTTGR